MDSDLDLIYDIRWHITDLLRRLRPVANAVILTELETIKTITDTLLDRAKEE